MRQCVWLVGAVTLLAVGCGSSVNVEQERNTLLARDREWSQTTKDTEKFLSYFAPDASMYPQGMPVATGTGAIRDTFTKISSMPGFSVQWTPTKADLSTTGDLGYTTGTYEMNMGGAAEKGKYVTVWKKQSDNTWKVSDDIFNADAAPKAPASQHVMLSSSALKWGVAPPVLPAGARMAVVSGDPGKAELFTVRLQVPAGYRIAAHWHPTDEHLTILSGTASIGMGEKFDQAALKDVSVGGYVLLPAEMRHFFMAKTAVTLQLHGPGPFVVNYVNPADDPSRQKK